MNLNKEWNSKYGTPYQTNELWGRFPDQTNFKLSEAGIDTFCTTQPVNSLGWDVGCMSFLLSIPETCWDLAEPLITAHSHTPSA